MLFLAIFVAFAHADTGDTALPPDPSQFDLNCNGILAEDEPPVDLGDPDCLATGLTSADAFFDVGSYACTKPITDTDTDGDGRSFGKLDPGPGLTVELHCDNCPTTYNPDQTDADSDSDTDTDTDTDADTDSDVPSSDYDSDADSDDVAGTTTATGAHGCSVGGPLVAGWWLVLAVGRWLFRVSR